MKVPKIIKLTIQKNKLLIIFSDISGTFEFSNKFKSLGEFTKPLKNNNFFKKVKIEDENSLVWPNGLAIGITDIYFLMKKNSTVKY
jgi:hypothetical protein